MILPNANYTQGNSRNNYHLYFAKKYLTRFSRNIDKVKPAYYLTHMTDNITETKQNEVYWFYQWPLLIRILLIVFISSIFVPIALWPKIKNPAAKAVFLGVWVIIFFIFAVIGIASQPTPTTPVANTENLTVQVGDEAPVEKQATPAPVEVAAEPVQSEPTPPPAPLTPQEKVATSIPAGCKGCTSTLGEDGTAFLSVNGDEEMQSSLNATHFFEKMLQYFIVYGNSVDTLPEVSNIEVLFRGSIVDLKGNTTEGALMRVSMLKDSFMSYNFENISTDRRYLAIDQEAFIYVLPTLSESINYAKVNVRV